MEPDWCAGNSKPLAVASRPAFVLVVGMWNPTKNTRNHHSTPRRIASRNSLRVGRVLRFDLEQVLVDVLHVDRAEFEVFHVFLVDVDHIRRQWDLLDLNAVQDRFRDLIDRLFQRRRLELGLRRLEDIRVEVRGDVRVPRAERQARRSLVL